jgi:hypothetical protein
VGAYLFHIIPRTPQHEGTAILAGIHMRAIPMLGLEDHLQIVVCYVNDLNRHVELGGRMERLVAQALAVQLGRPRHTAATLDGAKARRKVYAEDLYSLLLHDARCQHAVQSTGQKRDSPNRISHMVISLIRV